MFSLQAPVGVAALVATASGHWGELQVGDVPAAGLNDAFVFDAADEPVLRTDLVADGGNEVIFVNVDVSADSMPSAKNASDADCATDIPTAANPTQAKVITSVVMNCP